MKKYGLILFIFILSSSIWGNSKWDTLLISGIDDFNKGQYSFAITNFKKYILLSDDELNKSKALYYLSLSYYFDNKFNQALIYIDELTSKYKTSGYALQIIFWQGLIYQNLGLWKESEESFLRFIKLLPGSELEDRAYLAAANSQYEQGKLDTALASLKKILANEKSEKLEESTVLYSYILMEKKEYSEAKQILTKWEVRLGEKGEKYFYKDRLWLYLAEIYILENKDLEASQLLKKIDHYAQGSPSSDIALLRLSEIEARIGNKNVATEYILRLKNEYPESIYNLDALLLTGTIAYQDQNYEKAIEIFTQTIETIELKQKKISSQNEITRLETLKSKCIFYNAEIYQLIGEREKAFRVLLQILTENLPLKEEAAIRGGEFLLELGKIKQLGEYLEEQDPQLKFQEKTEQPDFRKEKRERYDLLYGKYLHAVKKYSQSLEKISYLDKGSKFYLSACILRVKNYVATGKLDRAIEILRKLLQKVDIADKAEIMIHLMTLNFNIADYREVILLDEALPLYLEKANRTKQQEFRLAALNLAGMSYMQLKEYEKSVLKFHELQNYKDAKNLSAAEKKLLYESYYYLGWVYYKTSRYKDASLNFSAAITLVNNEEMKQDAMFMNGWCFYSSQNYAEAAAKFMNIFDTYYPATIGVKALFQAAKSYQNIGNRVKALSLYKKIYSQIGENDYRPEALYEMIEMAFADNQSEEANSLINEFGHLFAYHPLYSSVLVLQINNFLVQERYSEVQSAVLNYLTKYSSEKGIDTIYYWGGYSAFKNKDYETAKEMLEKLLMEYPDSTFRETALPILIEIFRINKEYSKELETILQLTQTERENEYYKSRVLILEQLLDGVEEQEAELFVKSNAGDLSAKLELAKFYYRNGKAEEAISLFHSLKEQDRGNVGAAANNFLGDIEYTAERYKEALVLYADTISKYQSNDDLCSEALYKIAYSYHKLGGREQAEKYLDLLMEKYPQSRWVTNAQTLKENMK